MSDDIHDLDESLTRPLEGAAEASAAEGASSPAVGRDEWVARHGERRTRREGVLGTIEDRLRAVPWWAWLALFVAVVCLLPIGFEGGYVRRVAFDTVVYMLLALGLNVVVGWGGLLDLGYVAFFGVGAYTYALLASEKFDLHLPPLVVIPIVVAVGAIVGFLVGLPSRRLVGDYLAIVTLFFQLIFFTTMTNADSVFGHNLTGGPNGILNIDPLSLFGRDLVVQHEGIFNVAYLYVAMAFFVVVYVALRFVNESRTGRAWRSLREDPLAAELMGMPVNSLKLLAFAFGAAVAALTGSLFASLNASVFPQTFAFALLITIYTMVILGGSGSQAGVVVGAILVSVMLELLREPGDARMLFYPVVLLGLIAVFRLSIKLAVVLGGTLALGFVVHLVAKGIDDSWVSGTTADAGRLADWVSHWVVVPTQLESWIAPVSYISLVALLLVLTLLRGWGRIALLIPTLYLAAFVWENVMLARPEPTRFIVLGAMLIALMIIRPTGLLGEKRVQIV
ncbi:MAG TPA: branched-chain amino acid ABC transporter permease [Gaiellaceae bacterium]